VTLFSVIMETIYAQFHTYICIDCFDLVELFKSFNTARVVERHTAW